MIKLKNILAENMRRFGTKNLSETNLTDLEKIEFGSDRDPKTGNVKLISTFKDLEAALEDNLKDFVGDDVFYTTDENDDIVYVEILAGPSKTIVLNIIKNTLKTSSYKIDDIERSPEGDIDFSIVKR
jgi:hypothetical protein